MRIEWVLLLVPSILAACSVQQSSPNVPPASATWPIFEGRTWIDGEPVEGQAERLRPHAERRLPVEDGCSEVYALQVELGTGWEGTYGNIFALEAFHQGQVVQLHEPLPALHDSAHSVLAVQDIVDAVERTRAMNGGQAVLEQWSREHREIRYTGGEWCELVGSKEWSCVDNPHEILLEWTLLEDGAIDRVEDPSCEPTGLPVDEWVGAVDGGGTLCTRAPGSCDDYEQRGALGSFTSTVPEGDYRICIEVDPVPYAGGSRTLSETDTTDNVWVFDRTIRIFE